MRTTTSTSTKVRQPRLPTELFIEVIKHAKDDVPTLKALSRVSTSFHDIAAKHLYKTVVLSRNQLDTINKLNGLSGKPARFVETLVILDSAARCHDWAEKSPRTVGMGYKEGPFHRFMDNLHAALSNFLLGAKNSITALGLDFTSESFPFLGKEAIMYAVMTSLGGVNLGKLHTLSLVNSGRSDLRFLLAGGSVKPRALAASYLDKLARFFDGDVLKDNMESIRKLDIRYSDRRDLRWDLHGMLLFVSQLGTPGGFSFKDLTISIFTSSPIWIPEQSQYLPRINPTITSLFLSGVATAGVSELLSNCKELKKLSLSCMSAATDERDPVRSDDEDTPWYIVFLSCMDLELDYLLLDRLSHQGQCRNRERALSYTDENDLVYLLQLVDRVKKHGGEVLHGHLHFPLQATEPENSWLCRHKRISNQEMKACANWVPRRYKRFIQHN